MYGQIFFSLERGDLDNDQEESNHQDHEDENNTEDEDKEDDDLPNDVSEKLIRVLLMDANGICHMINIKKVYEEMVGIQMKNREKGSVSKQKNSIHCVGNGLMEK